MAERWSQLIAKERLTFGLAGVDGPLGFEERASRVVHLGGGIGVGIVNSKSLHAARVARVLGGINFSRRIDGGLERVALQGT